MPPDCISVLSSRSEVPVPVPVPVPTREPPHHVSKPGVGVGASHHQHLTAVHIPHHVSSPSRRPGPHLYIKTVFPRYGDSHVKDKTVVRPSFIFNMGIPILVRRHLYIEMAPGPGDRLKNAFKLLNLRAPKYSPLNKIAIFQYMEKIFCVEFWRVPLKFHMKYLTHTLKDMILSNMDILKTGTCFGPRIKLPTFFS